MARRGLKENEVDRIRVAFEEAHDIFMSLQGWPKCTIFRPVITDTAGGGDGKINAIEIYARQQEVEYDGDQLTYVGSASTQVRAYDITFEFHYDFAIPNDGEGYYIAFGIWLADSATFGPLCPRCGGTGVHSTDNWNNPLGSATQCAYCAGIGYDIYNDNMIIYKINKNQYDERMSERIYTCFNANNMNKLLMTIVDDARNAFLDGHIPVEVVATPTDIPDNLEPTTTSYPTAVSAIINLSFLSWQPDVNDGLYTYLTTTDTTPAWKNSAGEYDMISQPEFVGQHMLLPQDEMGADATREMMDTWDADTWLDWWLLDPDNRHMPAWISGIPEDGDGGWGPPAG
jgi:hypothetical protein